MIYLIILLPPLLYAVTNLIDKRLTVGEREDSLPSSLMLIGGLFNFLVALPMFFFLLYKGSFVFSLGLFLNGIIFSCAVWLYLIALKKSDTDNVIVWYQTIPVFGLIGAMLFLGEYLNYISIISIFLIVGGSIFMSMRGKEINRNLIFVMLISSLLISINDVIFAHFGREINATSAIFSDLFGKSFWALIFLLNPKSVKGFVMGIKTKFGLVTITELIFIVADAIFDLAKLFAPVAIVQALASTQPVFVFVGALIMSIFYPKILGEVFEKKHLKNKIIGLVLVVIGGVILALQFA